MYRLAGVGVRGDVRNRLTALLCVSDVVSLGSQTSVNGRGGVGVMVGLDLRGLFQP